MIWKKSILSAKKITAVIFEDEYQNPAREVTTILNADFSVSSKSGSGNCLLSFEKCKHFYCTYSNTVD
jgi:hypothetical protein